MQCLPPFHFLSGNFSCGTPWRHAKISRDLATRLTGHILHWNGWCLECRKICFREFVTTSRLLAIGNGYQSIGNKTQMAHILFTFMPSWHCGHGGRTNPWLAAISQALLSWGWLWSCWYAGWGEGKKSRGQPPFLRGRMSMTSGCWTADSLLPAEDRSTLTWVKPSLKPWRMPSMKPGPAPGKTSAPRWIDVGQEGRLNQLGGAGKKGRGGERHSSWAQYTGNASKNNFNAQQWENKTVNIDSSLKANKAPAEQPDAVPWEGEVLEMPWLLTLGTQRRRGWLRGRLAPRLPHWICRAISGTMRTRAGAAPMNIMTNEGWGKALGRTCYSRVRSTRGTTQTDESGPSRQQNGS